MASPWARGSTVGGAGTSATFTISLLLGNNPPPAVLLSARNMAAFAAKHGRSPGVREARAVAIVKDACPNKSKPCHGCVAGAGAVVVFGYTLDGHIPTKRPRSRHQAPSPARGLHSGRRPYDAETQPVRRALAARSRRRPPVANNLLYAPHKPARRQFRGYFHNFIGRTGFFFVAPQRVASPLLLPHRSLQHEVYQSRLRATQHRHRSGRGARRSWS